jgi:uncharacterized OB-fold protein
MLELPDLESTALAREHAMHAGEGALTLQTCSACGKPQYPYREVCRYCLGGDLPWGPVPGAGKVLAVAQVHASLHPFFRKRAPWRICSVLLEAGPGVIAYAAGPAIEAGSAVVVSDRHAGEERCVLVAEQPQKTIDEEET